MRFGVGGSESDGGRRVGAEGDGGEVERGVVVKGFVVVGVETLEVGVRGGGEREVVEEEREDGEEGKEVPESVANF